MRILLIRHPETLANVRNMIYGKTESEYSVKGTEMILEIIDCLKQTKADLPKIIYSSPRDRASKLARDIAIAMDVDDIIVEERIREMEFGIFEGMTQEMAISLHPEFYKKFMDNYSDYEIPEGESFKLVYERAEQFLREIIKLDKDCIVVSHAMFIKASIAVLLNLKLEECWHFSTKPGSITEIMYTQDFGMITELKNF